MDAPVDAGTTIAVPSPPEVYLARASVSLRNVTAGSLSVGGFARGAASALGTTVRHVVVLSVVGITLDSRRALRQLSKSGVEVTFTVARESEEGARAMELRIMDAVSDGSLESALRNEGLHVLVVGARPLTTTAPFVPIVPAPSALTTTAPTPSGGSGNKDVEQLIIIIAAGAAALLIALCIAVELRVRANKHRATDEETTAEQEVVMSTRREKEHATTDAAAAPPRRSHAFAAGPGDTSPRHYNAPRGLRETPIEAFDVPSAPPLPPASPRSAQGTAAHSHSFRANTAHAQGFAPPPPAEGARRTRARGGFAPGGFGGQSRAAVDLY